MSSIDPMQPGHLRPVSIPQQPARLPVAAMALTRMLAQLQTGRLRLIDPQGRVQDFGPGGEPQVSLQLASWDPITALMRRGDVGFAQAWIDGEWTTDNLTGLIMLASLNRSVLESAVFGTWFGQLLDRLRHLILRDNSLAGSRRNIAAHYDLGNAFYSLWLDETMTYSSACFEGDVNRSLADAQRAKYALALERTAVSRKARLLEIGCGWGGFAETAARAGHHVTGLTLSREQHAWAQSRLRKVGLDAKADLRLQDYRDTKGQFDAIVSIEMFEAVGERWWATWFAAVARLLAPGGRAVVQTITIRDDRFQRYRRTVDFIQTHIFPGGMLPSPSVFEREAARAGLKVVERHAFGTDYAKTMALWHQRFLDCLDSLPGLGFDDRFVRMWRFYLSYCEAGFRTGDTDVIQFVLTHR
jgi:cyclopropane-fatty-acyl-phospholipid synthase